MALQVLLLVGPPEHENPMSRSRKATRRLLSPVLRFLEIEAAGGLVLLAATTVALAWASSPWSSSYRALLDTELSLGVGPWHFARPLSFWVNDGLMTLFFFVVGLEIRRDIHDGELSQPRRAMQPAVAALAGMLLPAAIFIACNLGRAGLRGWGVPMATDIAFAVGILSVLGRRVAPPLRIFLLALAILDDIGAIVVIAIFYAGGITIPGLGLASAGVAAVLVLKSAAVRSPAAYLVPGVVVWAGLLAAGIHPTLAGVTLALLTPVRPAQSTDDAAPVHSPAAVSASAVERSPATYLQDALHGWVTFVIMPVFALVNAGVALSGASLAGDAGFVFLGIVLGLSVGKPAAILLALRASARWALPSRPLPAAGLAVTAIVAGVGFTMALFIAQLAFPPGPLLDTAKVAVLVGSLISAVASLAIGRAILPSPTTSAAASAAAAAGEVTADEVAAGAVASSAAASSAVAAGEVASSAVAAGEVASSAVAAGEGAAGEVASSAAAPAAAAAGEVTAVEVASSAVAADAVAADGDRVARGDGSAARNGLAANNEASRVHR